MKKAWKIFQLGSVVLLITLLSSPFAFGGTGFVLFCGSTMFLVGLLSWIAHLLSFQRRTFTVGQMAAFIPFAFLVNFLVPMSF